MNLEALELWIENDLIQYLFMATIVLGLINCIKYLMERK